MEEIWKDIEGYEGLYQVSNLGRVRSLARTRWNGKGMQKVEERVLKSHTTKNGYMYLTLSIEGKHKTCSVHRLVLTAFNPVENMENLQVNHIDENKENNRLCNLEWCTPEYNTNYGTRNKRASESKKGKYTGGNAPWYGKHGVKHNCSIPIVQLTLDGKLAEIYGSSCEAERSGFTATTITACIKGKRKTHGGYKWEYLYKYLLLKYPKITELNLFGKQYDREEVNN